jgi:hypothetical protein
MTDKALLKLVRDDKVHWSKRENGSQAYQENRDRVHELVKLGYILEYVEGCCERIYDLSDKGRRVLDGEIDIR